MTPDAYVLIGLTALIAGLVALLVFATLRLFAAARTSSQGLRGHAGDTSTLSVALEDAITRLKEQERATAARAEASERLSGEIIASITSGLLVVGLDGAVRIVNPAAQRLLGLPERLPPGDYRSVIGEAALSDTIDECLRTGKAVLRRTVNVPEGHRPASRLGVTVSPLFDGAQQLHGAVCLFSDLTAVQQLEEQLRLKESLAAVGEMTAGIAHEFRNGLATIHGYARLLDPSALPQHFRPYVEGIRAEAVSLGEIVNNFLNFARPTHLTLADVDIRALCERAMDDVRSEVSAGDGRLEIGGQFAVINGDEVLLRQAFSNLLRNAVEACAASGKPAHISVGATVDAERRTCTVWVDDNGPGIPQQDRDRIFKPFFTSKRNGTGLGLALVQKIVVSHNGRITASTSPLGGARLQVVLPIA